MNLYGAVAWKKNYKKAADAALEKMSGSLLIESIRVAWSLPTVALGVIP